MTEIPETGLRPLVYVDGFKLQSVCRNDRDTGNGIETFERALLRGGLLRSRNDRDTGNGIETMRANIGVFVGEYVEMTEIPETGLRLKYPDFKAVKRKSVEMTEIPETGLRRGINGGFR